MISINCPNCNASMTCDDSAVGQYVQCYACSQKFVAGGAPAGVMPPAAAPSVSRKSSGNSKLLPILALCLGGAALVVAIISLLLNIFSSPMNGLRFNFSKSAEKTAMAMFENLIRRRAVEPDMTGYFWQKYGQAAINDAEVEIEQDGDDDNYVVVFIKTRADRYDIRYYYYLKKNKDGYYVESDDDDFAKKVDEKWFYEVKSKMDKFRKADETSEIRKLK